MTQELQRNQPCGCVVCICENDERCHGCGARHCGTHPLGEIPSPVYVPIPHALTREQVEQVFNAVYWHGDQQGKKQCEVLDGIDAQRLTLTQQAQRIAELEEQWRKTNAQYESAAKAVTRQAQEIERLKAQVNNDNTHIHQQQVAYLDCSNTIEVVKAQLAASEQEAGRLKAAIDTLTCAVCKMDMQRALKGAE